ncbi:hypothetical protein EVAR_48698_1 [Eumeta japonica]|uniref:Uncharacterized protein n=1 Tax=Eumeta variegata TaxID=151549 RepID=A0A4C1XEM8_EUMVA|nr:hypothetical protein EVAR_48698_1 [Eumeta japonica]
MDCMLHVTARHRRASKSEYAVNIGRASIPHRKITGRVPDARVQIVPVRIVPVHARRRDSTGAAATPERGAPTPARRRPRARRK